MLRRRGCPMAGAIVGILVAVVAGCGTETTPGGDAGGSPAASVAALTDEALLVAEQMPAWNGAMGWVDASSPVGDQVLAVCALPTPESLGAQQVLARAFEAAGVPEPGTTPDPTSPRPLGINQVAVFTSEAAATAAVLAWEAAVRDCADPAAGVGSPATSQIGDLPSGSTWTASMTDPSQACPECGRFEFIGIAGKGAAVTLVGFGLIGQDANYEGDPLAESMTASLARLP